MSNSRKRKRDAHSRSDELSNKHQKNNNSQKSKPGEKKTIILNTPAYALFQLEQCKLIENNCILLVMHPNSPLTMHDFAVFLRNNFKIGKVKFNEILSNIGRVAGNTIRLTYIDPVTVQSGIDAIKNHLLIERKNKNYINDIANGMVFADCIFDADYQGCSFVLYSDYQFFQIRKTLLDYMKKENIINHFFTITPRDSNEIAVTFNHPDLLNMTTKQICELFALIIATRHYLHSDAHKLLNIASSANWLVDEKGKEFIISWKNKFPYLTIEIVSQVFSVIVTTLNVITSESEANATTLVSNHVFEISDANMVEGSDENQASLQEELFLNGVKLRGEIKALLLTTLNENLFDLETQGASRYINDHSIILTMNTKSPISIQEFCKYIHNNFNQGKMEFSQLLTHYKAHKNTITLSFRYPINSLIDGINTFKNHLSNDFSNANFIDHIIKNLVFADFKKYTNNQGGYFILNDPYTNQNIKQMFLSFTRYNEYNIFSRYFSISPHSEHIEIFFNHPSLSLFTSKQLCQFISLLFSTRSFVQVGCIDLLSTAYIIAQPSATTFSFDQLFDNSENPFIKKCLQNYPLLNAEIISDVFAALLIAQIQKDQSATIGTTQHNLLNSDLYQEGSRVVVQYKNFSPQNQSSYEDSIFNTGFTFFDATSNIYEEVNTMDNNVFFNDFNQYL